MGISDSFDKKIKFIPANKKSMMLSMEFEIESNSATLLNIVYFMIAYAEMNPTNRNDRILNLEVLIGSNLINAMDRTTN